MIKISEFLANSSDDEEEITKITGEEIEEALKKWSSRAKKVDGYAQADVRALGESWIQSWWL